MNKFDQFVKHKIKAKYYIRYADDFVVLSHDKKWLENIIKELTIFLWDELHLTLHPKKISIKTISSGVDYLGWVHFSNHRVLRTATKKRMFRRIKIKNGHIETVQSYLGLLKHGNSKKLESEIKDIYNTINNV